MQINFFFLFKNLIILSACFNSLFLISFSSSSSSCFVNSLSKNWKSKLFNYKSISYIFKLAKETNATFIGSDLKNHGIKNLNDYHVDRELTKQEEESDYIICLFQR